MSDKKPNDILKNLKRLTEDITPFNGIEGGAICDINEGGLSRFLTHTTKVDDEDSKRSIKVGHPFFIISAYLDRPAKENKEKSWELIHDIRDKGLGGFQLVGSWVYPDGKRDKEGSFLVPFRNTNMNLEEFLGFGKELAKKYEQYAVCYSDGHNAYLYYPALEKDELLGDVANFSTAGLYQAFSKVRDRAIRFQSKGDTPDRPDLQSEIPHDEYALEGYSHPNNHASAMGMSRLGILWQ